MVRAIASPPQLFAKVGVVGASIEDECNTSIQNGCHSEPFREESSGADVMR